MVFNTVAGGALMNSVMVHIVFCEHNALQKLIHPNCIT